MDVKDFTAGLVCVHEIIDPYIEGSFRHDERVDGIVRQLLDHGLIVGGLPTTSVPPREAVANLLQCVLSWGPAEKIAAELDEAGLLAEARGK